jgi:hypothetical protein
MGHSNPFESPKARLSRGKDHTQKLKKRISVYFKNTPYIKVVEKDSQGFQVHKIKVTKDVPNVCIHYAAEALEAIRSALDQAGYAAAIASGKPAPKKTSFPIGDDLAGLENSITGYKVCKDLPAEIVTLFRSFNPYKGGNDAIWTLNKLRNTNHTVLTPIGSVVGGANFNNVSFNGGGSIAVPRWDREKNEMEFLRVVPGGAVDYNVGFSFFVAFDKIDAIDATVPIDYLDVMAAEVRKVVLATEAECRRLGFIK